jgi:hypothetical protein
LRRKGPDLEPLYIFDGATGRTQIEALYANDRARAEMRANAENNDEDDAQPTSPTSDAAQTVAQKYASRAAMNF